MTSLRYALSQAFAPGGLLVFAFGLPAMMLRGLGETLGDFVLVHVVTILLFIASANISALVVARLGAERTILVGTALCVLGLPDSSPTPWRAAQRRSSSWRCSRPSPSAWDFASGPASTARWSPQAATTPAGASDPGRRREQHRARVTLH